MPLEAEANPPPPPAAAPRRPVLRIQPTDADVLFGRGRPNMEHKGNKALHTMADEYVTLYQEFGMSTTGVVRRKQLYNGMGTKREIVDAIIQKVHQQGGRFLRKHTDDDDEWRVVGMDEARAKVSHILRGKGRRKKAQETKQEVVASLPRRPGNNSATNNHPEQQRQRQQQEPSTTNPEPSVPVAAYASSSLFPNDEAVRQLLWHPPALLSTRLQYLSPPTNNLLPNHTSTSLLTPWTTSAFSPPIPPPPGLLSPSIFPTTTMSLQEAMQIQEQDRMRRISEMILRQQQVEKEGKNNKKS